MHRTKAAVSLLDLTTNRAYSSSYYLRVSLLFTPVQDYRFRWVMIECSQFCIWLLRQSNHCAGTNSDLQWLRK
jgi:hypothetical protein